MPSSSEHLDEYFLGIYLMEKSDVYKYTQDRLVLELKVINTFRTIWDDIPEYLVWCVCEWLYRIDINILSQDLRQCSFDVVDCLEYVRKVNSMPQSKDSIKELIELIKCDKDVS